MVSKNSVSGYLPDERPPVLELIPFAFQQIVVMFPATVLVALITGFHVSTTIFASGLATLCFILVTGRKIPLYYGSSFSYIAAIASIMSSSALANATQNEKIAVAQFGIIMSGLVSIAAGFVVKYTKKDYIDKVLPATVTGSIAIIIGLSLAGVAMGGAASVPAAITDMIVKAKASGIGSTSYIAGLESFSSSMSWTIALVTLLSTIIYSVYLRGKLSQLPILFGLLTGYAVALIAGFVTDLPFVTFDTIKSSSLVNLPIFTFPKPTFLAVAAIMPIAIATIPESTAHVYQLHIYVNNLAKQKNSTKTYDIENRLGDNLIGDGIGDIVSAAIGGPAGTNYGENISAMAISKNFSVAVLALAAILTMVISCFTPLINAVYSIPQPVIGGLSIYLFGVIAAQGVTIIMDKKVDMFNSKNLAVIATILVIGLGGSFAFPGGMIPMFGITLPAIATAAVFGIALNLILSIGKAEELYSDLP